MSNINVCISCDDNYAVYAGVVITSILSNACPKDFLCFYILDGGISDIKKQQILSLKTIKECNITFVPINEKDFDNYKCVCTHKYISIATYYRLKLASLLPQIDKIIYFDCDMVINSSLSELYDVDLSNYLIAGARDINKRMLKSNPTYINAGMIVFNLKNIREQNIEKKFLDWTIQNVDKIKVGDQTIINEVCRGKIKIVDDSWNVQSSNFTNRSSYTNNPKVIHYVAKNKPWNGKSFSYHKNLYFKYLQLTPWKLSDKELKKSLKSTAIAYVKYRPLFLLRPRFYTALFETYIKPLIIKPLKNNVFLVFNTACFGDNLICNALCQNIKRIYPDSKVVFIVDKPFAEVAEHQKDVDDVVIYDKKGEHKGVKGLLKFLKTFKYKNAYAAFITYRNTRNYLLAHFSHTKHVIRGKKLSLKTISAQEQILNLLKGITKEKLINVPIKYEAYGELPQEVETLLQNNKKCIALCCLTKNPPKDMPVNTAVNIIKNLPEDYEIIYTGIGDKCAEYAKQLENAGCKFINLVNRTSINELALVLKKCKHLISVDTGTMHLGYAVGTPTTAVFYEQIALKCWTPDKNIYPYTTVLFNPTAEDVIKEVLNNCD